MEPTVEQVLTIALDPGAVECSDPGRVAVDLVTQLSQRFAFVVLDASVTDGPHEVRRAALHQALQHLEPGGRLAVTAPVADDLVAMCTEAGLDLDGDGAPNSLVVWRRTSRTTVHDLVFEARQTIGRVSALELAALLAGPQRPFVVDTRTPTDRERTGAIAGSAHVPRTVLEWHLDPANGYRHPAAPGFDEPIVVVCNGGYSSSLAAASLARIGFTDVADLVGGIDAWRAAGLPLVAPDHSHLDLSIAWTQSS
jgi:rhodanese-related sulfurtransferase